MREMSPTQAGPSYEKAIQNLGEHLEVESKEGPGSGWGSYCPS